MLIEQLRLRRAGKPIRPAGAWLIPGGGTAQWLVQLVSSGINTDKVRLYVLPSAVDDRASSGLLVVPNEGQRPRQVPSRWLPYGRQSKRLWLPVDATLDPPIGDLELAELISGGDAELIFHPAIGLVACDARQALGVHDLLAAAPPRSASWNAARPGIAFAERLISVTPETPLDADQVLEESRHDIGRDAAEINNLPPSSEEPSTQLLPRAGQSLKSALAHMIAFLTKMAPHTGTARTWIDDLEDWANRTLAGQRRDLFAARNREILRLLQLLKNAPDEGLRFALPLTNVPHRGSVPPSTRLSQRQIEYGATLGSGPADAWRLTQEMRRRLEQQYRELANRELHLGRFGRAAYIFADLLGDFSSAAAALRQGGQYRAAAAVYRERLGQRAQAAQCLEQGGLWNEAIAIYQELEAWETVGDLYAKLDQPNEAQIAYRREAQRRHSAGDRLAAARLLEGKLHAPEEARAELEDGWPDSRQAAECFDALFEFFARHSRHADARSKISVWAERAAAERAVDLRTAVALVDRLTQLATAYPQPEIATLAADRTRVVVGALLPTAAPNQRRRFVSAIGRLVPADRLLARDCARFMGNERRGTPQPPVPMLPPPRSARPHELRFKSSTRLSSAVVWKNLVSDGDGFVAAGFRDCQVVLARATWDCHTAPFVEVENWRVHPAEVDMPILLELREELTLMHVARHPAFDRKYIAADANGLSRPLAVASHPAFRETSVAIATAPEGAAWIVDRHDEARSTLRLLAYQGLNLIGTYAYHGVLDSDGLGVFLHQRSNDLYLGINSQLCACKNDDYELIASFPQRITSLTGSLPHTRARLVATLERGVALVDLLGGVSVQIVANELEYPVAMLTPSGRLVVADARACQVYGVLRGQLRLLASGPVQEGKPVAIVATDHVDRFALCNREGYISVREFVAAK